MDKGRRDVLAKSNMALGVINHKLAPSRPAAIQRQSYGSRGQGWTITGCKPRPLGTYWTPTPNSAIGEKNSFYQAPIWELSAHCKQCHHFDIHLSEADTSHHCTANIHKPAMTE